MRRYLTIGMLVCATVPLVTGCSFGDDGTKLVRALGRVAATDATRQEIAFDDTGSLAKLTDTADKRSTGFGALLLLGAPLLAPYADTTEPSKAIAPRSASYTVSAGLGQNAVALLAGGQNADDVTKRLSASGWRAEGNRLVAPTTAQSGKDGALMLVLAQVHPEGGDVVYGGRNARLADVGKPKGATLAGDRRVKALTDCLGDVVAAMFVAGAEQDRPTMVAVGVRRPKGRNDTPRAVACAAWPTSTAADAYATKVRDALARGVSQVSQRQYAELLRSSKVDKIGGGEHVVAWQADTPTNARLVVQLLLQNDMPALPDCRKMLPEVANRVCG
jgi:hypothetical protein